MSQAEQADEQSLEQILSSIREKIATNDDLSSTDTIAESSPAEAVEKNGLGDTASPSAMSSPVQTSSLFAPKQKSDSSPAHDDDLSDILEDPLPHLVTSPATDSDSAGDATVINGATRAEPPRSLFGSIVPSRTPEPDATGPLEFGTLAAKLSGAGEPALTPTSASESTSSDDSTAATITLENALEPSQETESATDEPSSADPESDSANVVDSALSAQSDATDDTPRSMPTMASAFNMAAMTAAAMPAAKTDELNDAIKVAPTANDTSGNLTSMPAAPIQSSSTADSAATPVEVKTPQTQADQSAKVESIPAPTAIAEPLSLTAGGSKSVEDLVAGLLRPMLNEWLEANMPRIVENALRIEVLESSKDDAAGT